METPSEKNIVINLNCCGIQKECHQPDKQKDADTLLTELADVLIEKIQTFKIFPRTFTEAELRQIAIGFVEENLAFEEIKQLLENYFSIKSEQLALFYKYEREQSLAIFKDSPFDLSDFIRKLPKIDRATDKIIKECEEKYGRPFQIVSFLGVTGVEEIVDKAFKDVSLSELTLSVECPFESYPYLFPIGFGTPYSGWSVSTRKRAGTSDACNYHHHGFNKNISKLIPLTTAIISMIYMHGLGGRLYGQSRALYIKIGYATILLQAPVHIVNFLKIKKA